MSSQRRAQEWARDEIERLFARLRNRFVQSLRARLVANGATPEDAAATVRRSMPRFEYLFRKKLERRLPAIVAVVERGESGAALH